MRFLYFTKWGIWCIIIIENKSVITKEKQNDNIRTTRNGNELGLSNSTITKFLKGKMVEGSICKIYDTVMKL